MLQLFNFKEIRKSAVKVLAEAFLPFFGVIAAMVAGFDLDVPAAYQAAIAAAGAAAVGLAAIGGGLLGQLIDGARGFLKAGADEADALLAEAQERIDRARETLG